VRTGPRRLGRSARGLTALALATLALAACAGPPWFMGQPLDGRPSVPGTRKNPSWQGLQAEAGTARIRGQTVREFAPLIALDDIDRLGPAHRARLVTLLEWRAAELHALGRPIPESRDLDRLARLAPARAAAVSGEHAAALRAAGDEWLAVGATKEARAAYEHAVALGAADMGFRMRALGGRPPPPSTTLAELRAEVAALPLRAVAPVVETYLARGGRDRATIARGLAAARQEKLEALASRAQAALAAVDAAASAVGAGGVEADGAGSADAGAPAGEPDAAPELDAAAELDAGPGDGPPDGAPVPVPANLADWVLAGPTIEARLLPLVDAHPELLEDVDRAVFWVDLLLGEDETSPPVLALAALVFGRAARFGGTERMLMELAYATPDRAVGLARGAEIWEQLGRRREACAQWVRAARWRDDAEDPTWRKAIACARRDPGVADWREIRSYVLDRARPERRAAVAASLDADTP
jgi:hypothetical protein